MAQSKVPDYESIVSKFVFWFVLILAVTAALNVLNISSVSAPLSDMIGQFLIFVPNIIAGDCGFYRLDRSKIGTSILGSSFSQNSIDEKLSADVGVSPISENIAEIIYWLILLLFLPIVLSILGLTGFN